ncbi:hypothetical protein ACQ86N_34490 [Puia sp. P3]|uniref:hypothetical protein n=1 Tax=Puia sp. P3 TaxID=3423952 RepID=UPI003D675332
MRIITIILLFLAGGSLMAQDLDYPDFRSKKDNFAKINDQIIRGDVASFALAGIDESIGKAQLQTVPVLDYSQNTMKYGNDNIQVVIKTSFFMPTKHKLQFTEKHLVKIDGKPYYGGVYGEQPHTIIESVTVLVGKDTVSIPATAYNDLYEPKFSFNENGATRSRNGVYLSNDKHTFYIYMLNIDNGGAEYTWVIRDKQFIRRVVDFGFLSK